MLTAEHNIERMCTILLRSVPKVGTGVGLGGFNSLTCHDSPPPSPLTLHPDNVGISILDVGIGAIQGSDMRCCRHQSVRLLSVPSSYLEN